MQMEAKSSVSNAIGGLLGTKGFSPVPWVHFVVVVCVGVVRSGGHKRALIVYCMVTEASFVCEADI